MDQSISAIGSSSSTQSVWQAQESNRAGGFKRMLDTSAQYLGLSAQDLRTQIDSGKSLADIAKAEGKSVDGLKQALQAALPAPPTYGANGTSATSSTQGTASSASLDQIINRHPGKHHHHHHHGAVQSSTASTGGFTSSSVNLVV
jgi:hypothetical protein